MTRITLQIDSASYRDEDDCLAAAAADVAHEYGLEGWDLDARWADDQREVILVDVPDWAVRPQTSTNYRRTVMTTSNGYDSILLVEGETVIGAWSPATADDVRAYRTTGTDPTEWAETWPDATRINDYGVVVGEQGRIDDERRRAYWERG